jgi:transposase
VRDLMMGKQQRGRGTKYDDVFKRQLVAESQADGVSVPMVSERHGVTAIRIYAWRNDPLLQEPPTTTTEFTPVEISDADIADTPVSPGANILPVPHIEITLENGRRLSVSSGVDAGFVLELARGLAA